MIDFMTALEIAGVILGILSVYFTAKQNLWCWPTGLAMVVVYIIIFANARLYSDMLENIIYIFMQAYGWYYWVFGGKKKNDLPVSRLNFRGLFLWSAVMIIGTVCLGYFMAHFTNADVPYLDAMTTVMSLVAQWFLSKKIWESWILWVTVDIMALFIYSFKGLYLTTGLYAVFLGLAMMGLIEWYKSMIKKKTTHRLSAGL
jgi:nicotinamide mononucleotide transporter